MFLNQNLDFMPVYTPRPPKNLSIPTPHFKLLEITLPDGNVVGDWMNSYHYTHLVLTPRPPHPLSIFDQNNSFPNPVDELGFVITPYTAGAVVFID